MVVNKSLLSKSINKIKRIKQAHFSPGHLSWSTKLAMVQCRADKTKINARRTTERKANEQHNNYTVAGEVGQ